MQPEIFLSKFHVTSCHAARHSAHQRPKRCRSLVALNVSRWPIWRDDCQCIWEHCPNAAWEKMKYKRFFFSDTQMYGWYLPSSPFPCVCRFYLKFFLPKKSIELGIWQNNACLKSFLTLRLSISLTCHWKIHRFCGSYSKIVFFLLILERFPDVFVYVFGMTSFFLLRKGWVLYRSQHPPSRGSNKV